ncbi:hypothetical protein, partial [Gottfriedia solisilvae]
LPAYTGPMDYPKFQGNNGPVVSPYSEGPNGPMYRGQPNPYFDPSSQLFTPYAQNQSSYGVPYFEEDEN